MTRLIPYDSKYRLGALLWIASLQYYVVQLLVATAWTGKAGFSWRHNTISDLGNTVCGPYGDRLVCSPWHPLMNGSFVLLGLTMGLGAYLLWRVWGDRLARLGLIGLIAAGAGTVLVGLFPENAPGQLHVIGAGLPFVLGNLAMILIGSSKALPAAMARVFSLVCGLVGLAALPLFLLGTSAVLGNGGLERVVAYPQSIWMMVIGVYLLVRRDKRGT